MRENEASDRSRRKPKSWGFALAKRHSISARGTSEAVRNRSGWTPMHPTRSMFGRTPAILLAGAATSLRNEFDRSLSSPDQSCGFTWLGRAPMARSSDAPADGRTNGSTARPLLLQASKWVQPPAPRPAGPAALHSRVNITAPRSPHGKQGLDSCRRDEHSDAKEPERCGRARGGLDGQCQHASDQQEGKRHEDGERQQHRGLQRTPSCGPSGVGPGQADDRKDSDHHA